MEKLISVIVPVYNVSPYLDRCITSIVSQTYYNLEILLIDDGSTDDSLSIIRKWANRDNRIKALSKTNGGLSDARNFGIKNATGDFYLFVDSDDVLNVNIIMHLLNLCEKNDTAMSICSYMDFSNESEINIEEVDNIGENAVEIFDFEKYYRAYSSGSAIKMVTAWAKLYRKDLFYDIQYPVSKLREDEFTTYKLVYNSKKIAVSDAHYYYYFHRDGSIMSNKNVKKYVDYIFALFERDKFISKYYPNLAEEFGSWCLTCLYVPYLESLVQKSEDIETLKVMYNEIYKKYHNGLKNNRIKLWAVCYFPNIFSMYSRTKRLIFKKAK